MNNKLNCPNCAAPITGAKCEYCGTVFKKEETVRKIIFNCDGLTVLEETKPVPTITTF